MSGDGGKCVLSVTELEILVKETNIPTYFQTAHSAPFLQEGQLQHTGGNIRKKCWHLYLQTYNFLLSSFNALALN